MARYAFVARDLEGRTRRGTREAATEGHVLLDLRSSGLVALSISAPERTEARTTRPWLAALLPPRGIDVEIGLQQLAYMLKSGLPLLTALSTAASQSTRKSMALVWTGVSRRVQSGETFAGALAAAKCIPRLVIALVAVGESTGDLDTVLLRASEALERRRALATSLMTALAYPALVVVMSIGVVAYMMVALIPKLTRFLTSFGRTLPASTQLLVDISDFVQRHLVHGLVLLTATAAALLVTWALPRGRRALDRLCLRVPVVGGILRLAATAAFARSMTLLVASGVRLTEALRVVEPTVYNRHVAAGIASARERVLQGSGLSEPLSAARVFPPVLTSMVAVGEASGTLDHVFEQAAEFHDRRLQASIRRLGALIEPTVLIVLGGIVGFIYMAFFMAIYSIAGGRA